jgi:hypothetical protein
MRENCRVLWKKGLLRVKKSAFVPNTPTRKQFYFLSLLLKLVVKTDSEIESFNVETNCLIIRNSVGKRMKLVIDNAQESVNFNIKNFKQFNYLDVKNFVSVKFVPTSFDRLKLAEEVLDKKSLVKMFTS